MLLEARGRRSARMRSVPLVCADYGTALAVSTVRERSQWVANLLADYRGVRGQGRVEIVPDRGSPLIEDMLKRYFGATDSGLARWLLDRRDEEVGLRIEPRWLTSWDFSERMTDLPRTGEEVTSRRSS